MSTVSNPINAPTQAQHKLNSRAVDASIKSFAGGKVDTSATPTNLVEPTWQDALDMVNPLQQIPIVGDIYRTLSGDRISGLARVVGGFMWGGITGGFAAAASAAYAETNNDQSPGEQMVAALFGTDDAPAPADAPPPTMLAEAVLPPTVPTQHQPPAQLAAASAAVIQDATAPIPAAPTPPILQAGTPVFSASLPPEQPPAVRTTETPSLTIQAAQAAPLRDRLNRKNPSAVTPMAKPLDQYATSWTAKPGTSFLDQIPAQAATLSAAQKQNLQLLQGVADNTAADIQPTANMPPLPAPADLELAAALAATEESSAAATTAATGGSILAPAATGQHNPLPLQLVQDMMLQALEKYQTMHTPAATTGGLGLQ